MEKSVNYLCVTIQLQTLIKRKLFVIIAGLRNLISFNVTLKCKLNVKTDLDTDPTMYQECFKPSCGVCDTVIYFSSISG